MKRRLILLPIIVSLFVTGLFTFINIKDVRALDASNRMGEDVVKFEKPVVLENVEKVTTPKEHKPLTLEQIKEVEEKQARESLVKKSVKKMSVEDKIRAASAEYGIDADIAVAISRLETGHWKSNVFKKYNNVGGMMYRGKPMKFSTLDEGVDRFVRNLKKGYFDQGLNTPAKMQKKYCPPNSQWDELVEKIMRMK